MEDNKLIKKELGMGLDDANDSHRLTINRAAENEIQKALERINDGYQGGKVNRNQVAIWAIQRFGETLGEDEVKDIRADHLDEFSALDAVLRKAKESGHLPAELRTFLQKQMGLDDAPKKKNKKSLPGNNTNDVV